MKNQQEHEYAGFWIRVGAALIDSTLAAVIVLPVLVVIFGDDYRRTESFMQGFWGIIFSYVLPAAAVIVFWIFKSATPGKMATKITIVDANTGGKPSTAQFIGRYLGYYVSIIPLFLGIIWVGIDKRKQGWHDKLAGTVVIKNTGHEKQM